MTRTTRTMRRERRRVLPRRVCRRASACDRGRAIGPRSTPERSRRLPRQGIARRAAAAMCATRAGAVAGASDLFHSYAVVGSLEILESCALVTCVLACRVVWPCCVLCGSHSQSSIAFTGSTTDHAPARHPGELHVAANHE